VVTKKEPAISIIKQKREEIVKPKEQPVKFVEKPKEVDILS